MTVFNFGSINIDHVYRVDHFVRPGETLASNSLETVLGGKGANQSVALARAGVSVAHLGRLSSSDAWASKELAEFGVDVRAIELVDSPSGHAIIQVDANGENAIVLHGGANKSFDQASLSAMLASANAGDWLLLQNECNGLDHVFAIAEQKQLNIAFNPAPMHESVAQLPLHQCKILFLNEVEALQLAASGSKSNDATGFAQNEAAIQQELLSRYPESIIVLTLGSQGAMLLHRDEIIKVSAPRVSVVDSTGAGDTFVGYFLAGLIDQLSPEMCLQRACAAGALAVTVAGATPSIPTRAAVDSALLN